MKAYRVEQDQRIRLQDFDPAAIGDWDGKKAAGRKKLATLRQELSRLQELLYAENKHKLLIILQATDTGGKDGVIRRVFMGVNPQGVRVANFKVPTPIELAHDYLWRVHRQTPATGEIVIFNRSHYEDVLVVRVHQLAPKTVWKRRYEHINEFERLLADEGTTILKFFLHISRDEQKKRLLSRLDQPDKNWKFNPGDLKDRALWGDYQQAYQDMLNRTSTNWAPWYIVPANRKWYRNLLIAEIIVGTLKSLNMRFPPPAENLEQYRPVLEQE